MGALLATGTVGGHRGATPGDHRRDSIPAATTRRPVATDRPSAPAGQSEQMLAPAGPAMPTEPVAPPVEAIARPVEPVAALVEPVPPGMEPVVPPSEPVAGLVDQPVGSVAPQSSAELPEHTMATPRLTLTCSDGRTATVRGVLLVGRDPASRQTDDRHALFAVEDLLVSKTHLAITLDSDRRIWAEDRRSTNGVVVLRGQVEHTLVPDQPFEIFAADQVCFGDTWLRVGDW